MKFHLIFIFALGIQPSAKAQPISDWQIIPNPAEASYATTPGELIYSENLEMLVYTGYFVDSSATKFFAGYNGSEWIVLDDSVGGNFQTMVDYADGVLVGGGTPYVGSQYMPHIAYFDGANWSYPWNFNNNIAKLLWVNNKLFALGIFTSIDNQPIQYAAMLNTDGQWESIINPTNFTSTPLFQALAYYHGNYYISGNFELENGLQDFAILEGGELHQVGVGLTGSWTAVGSLVIYQDELYLTGSIPEVQGNIGNHILKWNDQELQTVGPLFTDESGQLNLGGSIAKTIVNNGYLFCGGAFQNIGNQPITDIARWDGSQWCGYSGDWSHKYFYNFGFIDGQIIMMQLYDFVDGPDYVFWKLDNTENVENCTEPLAVENIENESYALKVYPNPSMLRSGAVFLHLECTYPMNDIVIFDITGKMVFQKDLNGGLKSTNIELPSTLFTSGIYIIQAKTTRGIYNQKLVLND